MEKYISENENRISVGKHPWNFPITHELAEQRVNIERFALSSRDLLEELNILDGKFVRSTDRLMRGKVTILQDLLRILGSGSILLNEPDASNFIELSEYEYCYYYKDPHEFALGKVGCNDEDIDACRDACCLLKEYLEKKDPKGALDEIESTLESYRATIEENFSVSDILVEVGKNAYGRTKSYDRLIP